MGPCEGLCAISYRLLWADSSQSARGNAFKTYSQCWHFLGSHPSCLYQPTRQPCAAAHFALDGPMEAKCSNMIVHAIGPCEGLHASSYRLLWADLSPSKRRGQCEIAHAVGPWEGLHWISYRLLWADSTPLVRGNSFKTWANMSIFSTAILPACMVVSYGSSLHT